MHLTIFVLFISVSLFGQTTMIISKYDGTVDSLELSNIKDISFIIDTVTNPLPGQLVAYYPLNGDAVDSSGNGYNGLTEGTSPDSNRFGIDSSALSFNGIDSYVNIPYEFDYPAKTISFWFYADTIDELSRNILVSDNPNLKYGLTVVRLQKINGNNTLIYSLSDYSYDTLITPNEWHFITIVAAYKSFLFSLDGNIIKSGTVGNYMDSIDGLRSIILGASRNVNDSFFSGKIDELKIYNNALTPSQIHTLYQGY